MVMVVVMPGKTAPPRRGTMGTTFLLFGVFLYCSIFVLSFDLYGAAPCWLRRWLRDSGRLFFIWVLVRAKFVRTEFVPVFYFVCLAHGTFLL